MKNEGQLIYPFEISCFRKAQLSHEVKRSALLDTIELKFETGSKIVIVNGDEGMGKSTLLSQFAERHIEKTIGIFIDVINKQSYAEDNIITDIYRQIYFYVNGYEANINHDVEIKSLSKLMYNLDASLKRSGAKAFIVIDGLTEIPSQDQYIVKTIIDLMPLAASSIRFLFSAGNDILEKSLRKTQFTKIEILLFNEHEAAELLPDLSLQQIRDIMGVFKGIPASLETIRRLVQDGMPPEQILQEYSSGSPNVDLFEAEWNRCQDILDKNETLMGLLAFSVHPLKTNQAAEILERSEEQVLEVVAEIAFLEIVNDSVRFASNGVKLFAQSKLNHLEKVSLKKIVSNYELNASDSSTIIEITSYHEKLNDYPAILSQLSNNNIKTLFGSSHSINEAIKQIKIGRTAAKELNSESEMLRLSHAESALSGLRTPSHLSSELLCYLKEDDYESAVGLVSASKILEERLQLLATIASYQKKNMDSVDPEIERRVLEDYKKIDPVHLGVEQITDLASELFPAFPEMALDLINNIDPLSKGGSNKADYAFFRLSIEAIKKDDGSVDLLVENMESLEETKRDALSMLSLFKKGTPAEKIISRLEKFEEPGDAIYILRNWIKAFPSDAGAFKLCEKVLSLIISTSDYHPTASLYADIFRSLRHMSKVEGKIILGKIEPHLHDIKKTGPTIDYVRLIANIIIFEEKFALNASRVLELSDFIENNIGDESIKLSAMTLISGLQRKSEALKKIGCSTKQKNEIFEKLINESSDHIYSIKDALSREAAISIDNAFSWAAKLNTRARRDLAQMLVIKRVCRAKTSASIDRLAQESRKIKTPAFQNEAVYALLEYCSTMDDLSKSDIVRLIKLRNKIRNNYVLCELNSLLLLAIARTSVNCEAQVTSIKQDLRNSWKGIDGDWLRIEMAYSIHNLLLSNYSDIAKEYRKLALDLNAISATRSQNIIDTQVYSSDLAIRAFKFICDQKLDTSDQLNQLLSIINSISGSIPRLKQLSRLASVLFLSGKSHEFSNVLEEHLLPDLDRLGEQYSRELSLGFYWSAPVVFLYSKEIFVRKLQVLQDDTEIHDESLRATQRFLLNKCIAGDPFDPVKNHKYKISSKELEQHIFIAKTLKEDGKIWESVKKIIDIIVRANASQIYTRPQLNEVSAMLDHILSERLGHQDFITHEGYIICCEAYKLKLNNNKIETNWIALIKRTAQIPSRSDQVFIIGQIIEAMPSSLLALKKQILKQAVSVTDSLTCGIEKLARYDYLVNIGVEFDKPFVKDFVRRAVLMSTAENTEDYEYRRRSLIDTLYSMDKDFAAGLSAVVDGDPARKRIIEKNIEKKKAEKLEREEFDISSIDIRDQNLSSKYPTLTWSLLGKLNAENHAPEKRANFLKFVDNAAYYDFDNSYPLLSYYIHAIGRQCSNQKTTSQKMIPIFNSLVNGAVLFYNLCVHEEKDAPSADINNAQIVFGAGEIAEVKSFVQSWVSSLEKSELTVIDPYFDLEAFDFIAEAISKDPNFNITILTNYSKIRSLGITSEGGAADVGDVFRSYWDTNICSDSMPFINFIFCGVPSLNNEMPIHDRWILSGKEGLHLGGSINGFNGHRISTISKLRHEQVIAVMNKVEGYLNTSQKLYSQERIKYQSFSI
ncbi:hypothetical protein [uncultured Halopseudomonas sp.]|uniref:hypothetical protein n=1 Tax=uncultured Halopseudomonas sp. TaxID=2901193 RepID=UPI0030EEA900|tara:strand:- start:34628 stop:39529 length:4902 start_codon:yes stop_codon:yes gene_type:complete